MNTKRLLREFETFKSECPDVCTGGPINTDNLNIWFVTLFGPKDSPFEGGRFCLRIKFPLEYPF